MGGGQPPRLSFFGQTRSLQRQFSSDHFSPLPPHHRRSQTQHCSSPDGARVHEGVSDMVIRFPPSGAVVTPAPPGHPRGPRSLQPCVLGLPAKLCPVWPAGHKAVRDEWPCSHHGDWKALAINLVMWRPIHESEDEWWVPGTDPLIGLPPGTGLF